MNALQRLTAPRPGFALLGVTALALVAASVVLTEALDLAPCPLCVFQRMLYLLFGLLALPAAAWSAVRALSGALAAATAAGGLITALYQSWMQANPESALACGPTNPNAIERLVLWAGDQLPLLFLAWGECTSREWELLGLSIANWSALAFLGLGAAALLLSIRRPHRF